MVDKDENFISEQHVLQHLHLMKINNGEINMSARMYLWIK